MQVTVGLALSLWLWLRIAVGSCSPGRGLWLGLRLSAGTPVGGYGAGSLLIERSESELEVKDLSHDLRHLAPPRLYQGVQD